MRLRHKYEYTDDFGSHLHVWFTVGAKGAIHFHVSDLGEEFERRHGNRYSGGLEVHYRTPPDYMSEDAPSHDQCPFLGGPCWHDGSSLYAEERVIPFWRVAPDDHDRMFKFLDHEYRERFMLPESAS